MKDLNVMYSNIILMKYGVHAGETVESIVDRKTNELAKCGRMFWGYGGTLCHPLTQVRPFIEDVCSKGEKAYLLMTYTPSVPDNGTISAVKYSADKISWDDMPDGIEVLGSKFAIVCNSLKQVDFDLDLAEYDVPIGASKGKRLNDYIHSHVDKACGVRKVSADISSSSIVHITLCAEITHPFAVFVK